MHESCSTSFAVQFEPRRATRSIPPGPSGFAQGPWLRPLAGFLGLLLASILKVQAQSPSLPVIPANTFYITNYGALGDGVFTNTTAIQNAINAAKTAGGGTVRVTAGNFLCGPLAFANNLNLQLDVGSTLTLLPLGSYPGGDVSPANFISGSSLHDVQVSGAGIIDGQGAAWWRDVETNSAASRPNLINFSTCTRVLIQDITCSNSPSPFLVVKGKAGHVTIQRVKLYAPSSGATPPSHNTDGLDLAETNAVIRDCVISTGDDNIAMGSSASVTSDILVTNCAFGAGHGCSIGSYTSGGVSNITVINCTFDGTDNGIRLKSQRGRGGLVQNCNYYSLGMTNVDWPLLIYSYYEYGLGTLTGINPLAAANIAATNSSTLTSTTPLWRNITFSNITATVPAGRPPLMVWGLPEAPASNIVFRAVNITSGSTYVPGVYSATNLQFADCSFTLPANLNTVQLFNAQLAFTNSAPNPALVRIGGLATNGFSNALALYSTTAGLTATNAIDSAPLTLAGSKLNVTNHLRLANATPLSFVLGTNAATVNVRSNLFFDGTFHFSAGAGFTTGTYTLFTYGSTLGWGAPAIADAPAGYHYSFDTSTTGQVRLSVAVPAPPAPAGLAADASNSIVRLAWLPVPNALAYNLKRSTTSGGSYSIVDPGLTVTNFADTTVANGTTYYYVVSALNSGGESTNSLAVSATPQPALDPPAMSAWLSGGQYSVSWPPDHTGWRLFVQTNGIATGLSANWWLVAGSAGTNLVVLPVDPANGSVFLRLSYP